MIIKKNKFNFKYFTLFFISLKNLVIRLLLVNYLLLIFGLSYADTKKNNNDIGYLDILQLENSLRKDFIEQKELNDINYDLYRMRSSDVNDRVSSAQDPRGYFLNKHNNMFCLPQMDKKCKVNSSIYVYGDIKTNTLLSENIYKDREQINLFNEVIRNIVNPFPSNIALEMLVASDAEKELPNNKAALAENYASQARLGLSRNSFNTMLFNRLPLKYVPGSNINDNNKDQAEFSKLSVMEKQVSSRFANTDWLQFIDKSNKESLSKELIKMLAFYMWMEFEKYKQEERIESLLATLVAQQETTNNILIQKNGKKP